MEGIQTASTSKRDVKSLIKLISWIVGAVGAVALLISIISLIVLGSKDYTKNKKYVYEESLMGMTMKVELTLKDDGTFTEIANIMGEIESESGKFYVTHGKLYVDYAYDDDTLDDTGFEEYGKISATRIHIEDLGMNVSMVCKSAKTQQNISIAFVVIGSILIVASAGTLITIDYLSKRNRIIAQTQNQTTQEHDVKVEATQNESNEQE